MNNRDQTTGFAKRSLGQNFLVDQDFIDKIIKAVDPQPGETILEIGPGRGALTHRLVNSGAKVIAIELDRELVPQLREQFKDSPNFRVIEDNATKVDYARIGLAGSEGQIEFKVVANLPYYISTAILQNLASQRSCFSSLILMFQREVVGRITAAPGTAERGFLTVLVESAFSVRKLFDVPPNAFRPIPKVVSSVVELTPKPPLVTDNSGFRDLISQGFMQKRKTILNNLKGKNPNIFDVLKESEIDPQRRAESLTLDEWIRLFGFIN